LVIIAEQQHKPRLIAASRGANQYTKKTSIISVLQKKSILCFAFQWNYDIWKDYANIIMFWAIPPPQFGQISHRTY